MGCKVIFLTTLHDLTDWISEGIATLRKKKTHFQFRFDYSYGFMCALMLWL